MRQASSLHVRLLVLVCCLALAACTQPPAAEPTIEPEPEPSPTALVTEPPATASPTETPAPAATFTVTLVPSSTATRSPTPTPERVRVFGNESQSVNIRREPGTNSPVLKSVRDGTEVTIVGIDRDVDGRLWRNVQHGDAIGWIIGTALRSLPTPTITPSATPTAANTATPSPTTVRTAAATAAPGGPAPAGTAAPAGTPEPERVEITGVGSQGANLRAEPSTNARILQTVSEGTPLTIIGPDREAEGRTWRNVRGESGTSGWVIAEAVRTLATATRTPHASTATPVPAATPTSGGAATAGPTVTGAATPTPHPRPSGESGDAESEEPTPEPERVEVYDTGATGANLRARPGRSGPVLRSVPDGAVLIIIGDDQVVDGITWRHVQLDNGTQGWLAVEVVRTLVTPTPTPRPGAPGIGAPRPDETVPEDELTEEQRTATPCRPGQLKGDAMTGVYYPPDHPEYAGLRLRVRCFDDVSRARASGYRPPDPPEAAPSPSPGPQ